jgi:hypothetical protein
MTIADITLHDEGSTVGLTMETPAAWEWAAEKLTTEPWQRKNGSTLWVDYRVAPDLVELAQLNGLEVS